MTPERQREKIAELCGWKPDDDGAGINTWEASWVGSKLYGQKPVKNGGRITSYQVDCLVPDYLNDLNAMYEAVGQCKTIDADDMASWLYLIYRGDVQPDKSLKEYHELEFLSRFDLYRIMRATAAQHAEAFLRTMGAWEE